MKKLVITLIVVAVLGGVGYGIAKAKSGDKEPPYKLVAVEKGTIVDKALATGQIVPKQEIQVKSQISGIVKEAFVDVGDVVKAGEPLFSISPDPTPLQLTEAERDVELAQVSFQKAKSDLERLAALHENGLISEGDLDGAQQSHDRAKIQLQLSNERLLLLREGRIKTAKGGVDSIIRAPASGTVLERLVNPGDPVVPLTTFQAGTPLMTLADMGAESLVFKGTVDEIDVGKLHVGMPVRLDIGALPDAEVTGTLVRIAPKAKEEEGSTLFDVEVVIDEASDAVLRAGYSANANVIIQEKKDVLVLPERLVVFEEEKPFVEVPGATPEAEPTKKAIAIGLSDGLNVEVVEGLAEGEEVVEHPPKVIEAG